MALRLEGRHLRNQCLLVLYRLRDLFLEADIVGKMGTMLLLS